MRLLTWAALVTASIISVMHGRLGVALALGAFKALALGLEFIEPQTFSVRGVLRFEGAPVSTCEVTTTPVPAPKCPPPEPCGVYCEFGQAKDENGCTTCGCNPNPLRMPGGKPF